MASVYIETTIPSFYYETRTSPLLVTWRKTTRDWWDRYRVEYDLYISRFVLEELSKSPRRKAEQALRLLDGIPVLAEPPRVEETAQYYVRNHLMPAEAGGDAYHLALASIHGLDYMLTWNCRHLANAAKIQHMTVLNARRGLHVPFITTPLSLLPER